MANKKYEVGGSHYKMAIEPIDFIMKNKLPFCEGNIIKYVCRHPNKSHAEDIEKAISYCIFILKDKYCYSYDKIASMFIADGAEKIEQNPTWSEEDENEVAVLEAYIRSKDWSEMHIDRALGIVNELVKKLKSLRPQNTWKPSEFQLECLRRVIPHHDIEIDNELEYVLTELYDNLKKL